MNIFILDRDVRKCAQYHCDKHVVKMIVEYTQILCTALWNLGVFNGGNTRLTPQKVGSRSKSSQIYLYSHLGGVETRVYAPTHRYSHSVIWAQHLHNWVYLRRLAKALGEEYTFRYGKVHASMAIIDGLPIPEMTVALPTTWVRTMPKNCKIDEGPNDTYNAVESYRMYYMLHKSNVMKLTWTKRDKPYWFYTKNDLYNILPLGDRYEAIQS